MVWQRPIGTGETKTELWREQDIKEGTQAYQPGSGTGNWEGWDKAVASAALRC